VENLCSKLFIFVKHMKIFLDDSVIFWDLSLTFEFLIFLYFIFKFTHIKVLYGLILPANFSYIIILFFLSSLLFRFYSAIELHTHCCFVTWQQFNS
jgi:hypothetical protein